MTRTQTLWKLIWDRAAQDPAGREPFEVAEVAPAVAAALNLSEGDASRKVTELMGELGRMPDDQQYFALEGRAIVPLAEFRMSAKDEKAALAAYPFEV